MPDSVARMTTVRDRDFRMDVTALPDREITGAPVIAIDYLHRRQERVMRKRRLDAVIHSS
jgi:hypothetical protein